MKPPKRIDALQLGGTLFVPAVHKHLEAVARAERCPGLRSMVIDTEDGIAPGDLPRAMARLEALLGEPLSDGPLRFVRPRNPEGLQRLLAVEGIEKIDGFVLPKFGLHNAEAYLAPLREHSHAIMPSIEGNELFDAAALAALRDRLLPWCERIPAIRFGAEDLFAQLGLRRDCAVSLYDMAAPSQVIGSLLNTFRPHGFDIAAPLYRCYRERQGFMAEVRRDLSEGFVGKTLIHPDQIALFESAYHVDADDYAEAKTLLERADAVTGHNGAMAERVTQHPWAEALLVRAERYGITEPTGDGVS